MSPQSKTELMQWLGVVATTVAFVSIPYTFGVQPGTPAQIASADRNLP